MKESTKFSKDQLERIGVKNKPRDLLTISKEQFKLKQDITEVCNDIWQWKNTKLKYEQEYAKLEKEKDAIFVNLGLKLIPRLEKDKD